ncbi:MAG: YidH family protein [Eubacteriales bacterium]
MNDSDPQVKPGFKDRLQLHLANERTFLAWMRTSISMIAIGFLVMKFNLTELSTRALENPSPWSKSDIYGALFIFFGLATNLVATARFLHFRKEIEKGEGVFSYTIDLTLAVFVVAIALFLIVFTHRFFR